MNEHTVGCPGLLSVTFTADPCWPAIYAAECVVAAAFAFVAIGVLWSAVIDWRMRRRL